MTESQKKWALAAGGVALVLLALAYRGRNSATVSAGEDGVDGLTPAAPPQFNSSIVVEANPDRFGQLSNDYMPTFGFVGVGVTGSLPTTINTAVINVGQIATPPQSPSVILAATKQPPKALATSSAPSVRPDGYYNLTGGGARRLTAY